MRQSCHGGVLNRLGLAYPETLGRRTAFVATGGLGGPALQSVSYGYDAFGRLESLASPDLAASFAYHPGSSLIAGIAH